MDEISYNSTHASQLTSMQATQRHTEFEKQFQSLDESQFSSKEEYRAALIQQYKQMREVEYQQICLNEGLKAYDISLSICERTGDNKYMNKATWNGCRNILKKYPDMQTAIADSCYVRIPTDVTDSLSAGGSYSCCAVSSKALESQISAKMGFDGDQNFVKPYHDGPQASYHRAANGFVNDPACEEYVQKGNLWNLINDGKVGPGSSIAIRNSKTESGYHAKTVIAVNYDDQGNLKSYTLQGNNNNSLEVITQEQKNRYNNIYAVDMNRWTNNQLEKESQNMLSLPTDQLESSLVQTKERIHRRIDELTETEKKLFENHQNKKQVNQYADWYVKDINDPEATKHIMKIDGQNAAKQMENTTNVVSKEQNNLKMQESHQTQTPSDKTDSLAPKTDKQPISKVQADAVQKIKSRLQRMNDSNGSGKKIDVDLVASCLIRQFGDNADNILVKALMAPSQLAQNMGLKDGNGSFLRTSREVIEYLGYKNEATNSVSKEQSRGKTQESRQIQTPSGRTDSLAPKTDNQPISKVQEDAVQKMKSRLQKMNEANGSRKQIDVDLVASSFIRQFGDDADKLLVQALMAPSKLAQDMGLKDEKGSPLRTSREVIERLSQTENTSKNAKTLSLVNNQQTRDR